MYTEKDSERMQAWDSIASALLAAYTLYGAKLASDSQADKPTFAAQLDFLIETAQAQTKLWRNPNTCTCGHSNDEHEKYHGPCNVRTSTKHCICYQFRSICSL